MWKKINHGGDPTKNIDKKTGSINPNIDKFLVASFIRKGF